MIFFADMSKTPFCWTKSLLFHSHTKEIHAYTDSVLNEIVLNLNSFKTYFAQTQMAHCELARRHKYKSTHMYNPLNPNIYKMAIVHVHNRTRAPVHTCIHVSVNNYKS